MKIKNKLRLSYFVMILIPVILIMLTGWITQGYYEKENLSFPLSAEFLTELYDVLNNEPEKLLSEEYLLTLANKSGNPNFYLQVYREDVELVSTYHGHDRIRPFERGWEFYFSDDRPGYLSTIQLNHREMVGGKYGIRFVSLLFIVVLIISNSMLTWFVARSILTPLDKLKAAANRIKNEDLHTALNYENRDEYLPLINAFEEMRIRLLDSLNEQLKAEENRKELLSNISHDLKTPITTIKGYVEGIRDGVADSPEKVEKYIDTIYKKSTLMDELIDSLLLFSKLDLNKVQFNFRKIDLSLYIRDLCEDMSFDYPELELMFYQNSSCHVKADVTHLHRVFANLIDNAVKYRSEFPPEVRISMEEKDSKVYIRIRDNGKGIAADDLPHIFDRFYRADRARSSEIQGSGLGLAISKQIIESHGGTMTAFNNTEGGTEIVFTLKAEV